MTILINQWSRKLILQNTTDALNYFGKRKQLVYSKFLNARREFYDIYFTINDRDDI